MIFRQPLLITAGGLGDHLYLIGFANAIAKHSQNGTIDIAGHFPRLMWQLFPHQPWCRHILDTSGIRRGMRLPAWRDFIEKLKENQNDIAFIMHSSQRYSLAAAIAKIPKRVAVTKSIIGKWCTNDPILIDYKGMYSERWGARRWIGGFEAKLNQYGIQEVFLNIPLKPDEKALAHVKAKLAHLPKPWWVSALHSEESRRSWPIEHATKTLHAVIATYGGSIILFGGKDTQTLYTNLQHRLGNVACYNTAHDPLPFDQGLALMYLAHRYIGIDTFAANLAFNANLPAVVLFLNTDIALNYAKNSTALIAPNENMGGFSVQDIIEALR